MLILILIRISNGRVVANTISFDLVLTTFVILASASSLVFRVFATINSGIATARVLFPATLLGSFGGLPSRSP